MIRVGSVVLSLYLLVAGVFAVPVATAQDALEQTYEQAYFAWDEGDYLPAIEGFISLLQEPGGERFLENIALLTGELYQVEEVTPDGRAPRFSPCGGFAAYETRSGGVTTVHILRIGNGFQEVAQVQGRSVAFSPTGSHAAYLALRPSDELMEARTEADGIRGRLPAELQARINWLEARDSRIVLIDLASGQEQSVEYGGLVKAELAFSADGQVLYIVAAARNGAAQTEIFGRSIESGRTTRLTSGPGSKISPQAVPGGRQLVYEVRRRNPLPQQPDRQVAGSEDEVVEGVAVHSLASGEVRLFGGQSPMLSRDGSTLALTVRNRDETLLRTVRLPDGQPVTALQTTDRISAPAISPDGSRIAYQMMPTVSWEIFLVDSQGGEPERLTRNIQHDLGPMFLTDDLLVGLMGESRHRRSHLYRLSTGERQRLFHNNTVRTIAPEYQWAVSPDGRHILIVSERDGDTISPERGVYLMDVGRKIDRRQLLARLEQNLEEEKALRERGEAMFAPIAADVSRVVDGVSITRLFEYQEALYQFDSKFITQPGNLLAAEYLADTFRSFGYEPVYQWFEARGARTANVLGVLPGTTHPELIYVLSSHYDSVLRSPGADDNSSGIAVLLEAARLLARNPQPATIVFAALTGEEAGLLGAREFVRVAEEDGDNIVGVVNNDMIGFTRHYRLDNTIRYSNAGIRDVQHAGAFLFSDLITYDAHYYRGTDAAVFYQAYGDIVGGLGSYPVLHNPHYHRPTDVLETVNHYLVRESARATTAAMMLLASSPSRLSGLTVVGGSGNDVEVRWTASPERDVNRYEVAYGPENDPKRETITVTEPRVTLNDVPSGTHVAVRAINDRGLHGWDWARAVVGQVATEAGDTN